MSEPKFKYITLSWDAKVSSHFLKIFKIYHWSPRVIQAHIDDYFEATRVLAKQLQIEWFDCPNSWDPAYYGEMKLHVDVDETEMDVSAFPSTVELLKS